jgi:mRNA-degrading endonuclease RelE of RelBE toxin-antitoxin system
MPPEIKSAVEEGLKAADEGAVPFVSSYVALLRVEELPWDISPSPFPSYSEKCVPDGEEPVPKRPHSESPSSEPSMERRPDWLIGMTDAFIKAIEGTDKKLKGRILEAISDLSEEPAKPRGDTVKPLASGLKGLWRYRIGDYRLIYRPDGKNRQVLLLAFASREAVYD